MTIETTINRMLTQGGSFASSLAHIYTLADPDNQARIRYAFGSLLESYGHPKPDACDRTDELRPEMNDDALAEWANWAQGELRARLAANVDLKLWHDAAMKRIADLERQVRDGNLQRQLKFERGVAGIEETGDAESDAWHDGVRQRKMQQQIDILRAADQPIHAPESLETGEADALDIPQEGNAA